MNLVRIFHDQVCSYDHLNFYGFEMVDYDAKGNDLLSD